MSERFRSHDDDDGDDDDDDDDDNVRLVISPYITRGYIMQGNKS
jgi:hypothetical protein